MAFLTLTQLTQRVITRLRMVAGAGTQLYAEDVIAQIIEETYEMVRLERWWDHMMNWQTHRLDGTTGQIVGNIVGARQRFSDIRSILSNHGSQELPQLSSGVNPFRLAGTLPRYIQPLTAAEDVTATKLFRVWPMTAVANDANPLRVLIRLDPANLFTNPNVVVPFDATCLINGAAFKYAADDAANMTSVAQLQSAFNQRLDQLRRQSDSAAIILDSRSTGFTGINEWVEDWR